MASHDPFGPLTSASVHQSFARNDNSVIGRWWWTVDRWMLLAILILIAFGILMSLAAAPSVAVRIDASNDFALANRQLMLVPVALLGIVITSLIPPLLLRRLCVIAFVISLVVLALVLVVGVQTKGAVRWINVLGFSLQPSEFAKPLFAVTCAWLLATQGQYSHFPGRVLATFIYIVTLVLLLLEPDFGQALLITSIWAAVMFFAGLPMLWFFGIGVAGLLLVGFAYYTLEHVQRRIHDFFSPTEQTDTYQIDKSLEAFRDGGLFGKGPGEGSIKGQLPDAHADFVYAVIGEEFGLIACVLLLGVIMFVVYRAVKHMSAERDLFIALAIGGIATQFLVQNTINMATSLNLIPTKGMTMPFVSYGGSSLLASAFMMGALLAFTRKRSA
ncbi:MAG: FtsW/RodA/SpoVE family cell cycle protein [Alphaproteobacteria bacterium]